MNKIFKVVWSKVKRCYVVVSEVAKNVINGSVKSVKISGTPMTRGLALGAMMAFVITGNAGAEGSTYYLPGGSFDSHNALLSALSSVNDENDGFDSVTSTQYQYNSYFPKNNYSSIVENKRYISSNKLIISHNSNDFYYNVYRNFIIASGLSRDKDKDEVTIKYCNLIINNDIYTASYMELAGGQISPTGPAQKINGNISGNEVDVKASKIISENGYIIIAGGNGNVNACGITVENNRVKINNTDCDGKNGGIGIYGGTAAGYVNNNHIEINGKIWSNAEFCGGCSLVGGIKDGTSYSANYNTITLSNLSLEDDSKVYGGQVEIGEAKVNTINISNVKLQNVTLYGGFSKSNGEVSGNTLNVVDVVEGAAKTIGGFATINYDNLKWNPNGTVLETKKLVLDSNGKLTANVNGLADGSTPKKGEVMTLLFIKPDDSVVNNLPDNYLKESTSTFNSGSFLKAEGKIYQDDDDIKLKITRVGTNDQALVIGESRVAATAFANQGSELIEIGLDSLARDKSDKETKVFASVFGNASEYATGSHVKVNGWSGIVGVAKTNDDGLTTGAFFENGEGNYRTFNNFEGFLMRGDGEANYNGGGFFARKDNANGVYTEASLRAGNLQNELRKAVITDSKLEGYDIDTFYYGAHVGVGRIIPRGNEGDSIDVYGKFIYTHHDSEDFAIGGDNFHFDSIDSERLRLGFRINEVQNDKLRMYYGAAYEYEFDGEANNTVLDYNFSSPDLGGSTVVGELGLHYNADAKWCFDVNIRGYAGQRDGFTGSVQANYLF